MERNEAFDGKTGDTISDLLTQRRGGDVILAGRYRIVRKLGEGGMGSVWLAEDRKLDGRQVAIKMLPVVLATNARAIQQLKAEAKVAMQLSHAHVVTLRSFEDADEGAFLVLDYVPGKTLEQILAEKGTLPEDDVIRIFKPIAEALDHAHRHKVVHRDVKPSNIIIHENGEPFVMDFGIAREMKDTMTRVTGKNSSGTLPYMSPEQLRGEEPTPAQDIYSLAATIYECLSGHPPFHRGQIEYQIANEAPKPLASNSPLAKAVMAGLSKQAEGRPASAEELVEGQKISPQRAQRTQRGRGWKWAAGIAVLAGLVAAAVLAGAWIFLGRDGAPRRPDGAGTPPSGKVAGSRDDRTKEGPPPDEGVGTPRTEQPPDGGVGAPKAEESPAVTYAEAVEVKSAAETRWERAEKLDRGQAFGRFLDECREKMNAAGTFWGDKEYALAKGKYDEVAATCDQLFRLEAQRQAAADARATAQAAQGEARDAGAEADAAVLWGNAGLLMQQAAADYERPNFSEAQKYWTAAAGKYAEAKDAAAAKAERDAQARAAAEAKRKADEAAAARKAADEAARNPDLQPPFKNSLGMEFVPVAGLEGVLFSKWETRVQDYAVFTRETGTEWPKPDFEQGPTHPAVNVSWNDAQEFCEWLTKKERSAGKIGPDQRYRLPADWEWSVAVGLNESRGGTPESKDAKIDGIYPWNRGRGTWPPTGSAGNYCGQETRGGAEIMIDEYNDGYRRTSPVGSFNVNANGLFDMGGNVWEWCEDFYDGQSGARVLRGGSWDFNYTWFLLSSSRNRIDPECRFGYCGFRVVLSRASP